MAEATDAELTDRVMALADEHNIPLDRDYIQIHGANGQLVIDASYVESMPCCRDTTTSTSSTSTPRRSTRASASADDGSDATAASARASAVDVRAARTS